MVLKKEILIGPLRTPVFLSFLPFSFIAFLLPIYGKSLDASAMSIGGLFSIFTASTLIFRPLIGSALDRFGRKKFILSALVVNTIAMIVFIFATNLPLLYIARFIQGIGFLFLTISIVTMVADMSADSDRGKAMGISLQKQTQGRIVGVGLGFSFFMFLPGGLAWQMAFLFFAVMTSIATFLAWKRIPETNPSVIINDAFSSEKQPVFLQLFKLMVVVCMVGISFSMLMPISLIMMQDKFAANVESMGLVFLPGALVIGFLSSRLGKLSDRFGRLKMMFFGLAFTGLSFLFVPLSPSMYWLAVVFFLIHTGLAIIEPAQTAMVVDIVGHENRGKSYGWYDLSRAFGLTIGPLTCGWLYDNMGPAIPFYFSAFTLFFGSFWLIMFMRKSGSIYSITN